MDDLICIVCRLPQTDVRILFSWAICRDCLDRYFIPISLLASHVIERIKGLIRKILKSL